jgi:hypothetical protein
MCLGIVGANGFKIGEIRLNFFEGRKFESHLVPPLSRLVAARSIIIGHFRSTGV